jgi:hypothetical protein
MARDPIFPVPREPWRRGGWHECRTSQVAKKALGLCIRKE